MKNLKSKILKILMEFIKEAVHNKNKHLYAFPDATDKLLSLFKNTMLKKMPNKKGIYKSKIYDADDRRYAYGFNEAIDKIKKMIEEK
jgi:hypothetical protein